ncbi:putative hydrolase [Gordonia effusa NBRC 100432]|uniref:Putative hydrolase n=1 Tax=Gordonia effusa NBRC 100432 TaxID=1077974 RepID=H0QXF3_9ACTN|nr:SDR family oxidoreductase [Gordonia effusa]GAB17504.1 putative hydrolase [Gordonia effusa NBRC 100432]
MTVEQRGDVAEFVRRDDVEIAYYRHGDPNAEVVLLVHGWPDSHHLWDQVVGHLVDRFHVVTVDNRGAGQSTDPSSFRQFRISEMARDYLAVADVVSPERPVHILGHDWGSVAVWEWICDPDIASRVASFTSVSGPSGDHLSKLARQRLASGNPRDMALALGQFGSLLYMFGSSMPVLPDLLFRATMTPERWRAGVGLAEGIDREKVSLGPTFTSDIRRTLRVYRANFLPMMLHPRERFTDVPVQVIVGTRDPAVRQSSYDNESEWNDRTWRRVLKAGHWLPHSHPAVLARATTELIDHVNGKEPARDLARAEMGIERAEFGDQLVVISGAGSGIGRASAQLFAALGAEVVVSDIDADSAHETVRLIVSTGGRAHAYHLDVGDPAQVRAHVEAVVADHGVPDVVVNNAGVGAAGRFLDTTEDEFNRVLSINLFGVVNCARAFAAAMVERGTGGYIVNLSSMAAYSPGRGMAAYSTSKSAVFMFSDCLRAELAEHGIGVSTICPGIVHTNIVATTKISGVDADEERRLQDVGDRAYAMRRYGPEKVAKQIVRAVVRGKAVVPVTPEAHIQYRVNRAVPGLVRYFGSKGSITDLASLIPGGTRKTKENR